MKIIKTKELSRGYKVVLSQVHEKEHLGDFDKYDVEVQDRNGATIVVLSTGCIGLKSGETWMNSAIQYMQRLLLLVEDRDMAYHNLLCYSTSYLMNTPKEGYEDKWNVEREKATMIEQWLVDLSNYYGKTNDRGHLIRLEFDIDEIFVDMV